MSEMETETLDTISNSDSISAVVALATDAMKPSWLEFPGNDGRKQMILKDGTLGDTWMPERKYSADTVDGFMTIVDDLAKISLPVGDENHNDMQCRIFVGRDKIEAVFDERGGRRDRVTLKLNMLESISQIGAMRALTQKSLEWKLRSVYPDRVKPETFLPAIRKLKIKENAGGGSTVSHGSETVDMSVEAEVAGVEGGIDEVITLFSSIYEEIATGSIPLNWGVKCSVLIDVQDRKFTIKPQEGEVANAILKARQELIRQMREISFPSNVSIFVDSSAS